MFFDDPFIIKTKNKSLKDNLLSGFISRQWEGEDMLGKHNAPLARKFFDQNRIKIYFVSIFLIIAFFGIRLIYLQIIRGSHYRYIAEGNRIRIETIKAPRGIIYDKNGKALVQNIPSFSIVIIPADLPKDKQQKTNSLTILAKILKKELSEIEKILEQYSRYSYQEVVVENNLNREQALLLQTQAKKLHGILLKVSGQRHYLDSEVFAHLIGYLGKINTGELKKFSHREYSINDYIGKSGVEEQYEPFLKGKSGKNKIEVDSLGNPKQTLASLLPVAGSSVVLNIDAELQNKVHEVALSQAKKVGSKKVSVIVMDPRTGAIRALVSLPSFDNNIFNKQLAIKKYQALISDENQPLFFRALSGEYPSGSTFKMVVATAALEEDIITQRTSFMSTGGIWAGHSFFADWKAGGHGSTNVHKALAESVNTFFYIIGGGYKNHNGLGLEKIVNWSKQFGLDSNLGIDLKGEATGFLPSREWKQSVKGERWYLGNTYHLAIGQGDILVTPLQVAAFTSVFANQGTLFQPLIVDKIIHSDNKKQTKINPKIINKNFLQSKTIEAVRTGLRMNVTSGSGVRMSRLPVAVAGKTGTAQVGGNQLPHSWFTSFAPYENPEIVVTALIENGAIAGPTNYAVEIARQVMEWYFTQTNQY